MNPHEDDTPPRLPDETHPQRISVFERIGGAHWSLWAVALSVFYIAGAEWTLDQNVDVLAAALPGWQLVTNGTLDLQTYVDLNPWIVETPNGAFSNRPLGLVAAAALAFLPTQIFTAAFTTVPTTILSIAATGAAVVLVGTIVRDIHGRQAAGFTVLALGFGSATWPISASQMWPHGLDQLYLALAMLAYRKDRPGLAAAAAALMVTTRPPLAIVPVAVAAYMSLRERRITPTAVGLLAGTAAGVGAVLWFNALTFGEASLSGGYGDFVSSGANYRTPVGYLTNVAGTLLDPLHGVFIWSMWIVPSLIGLVWVWRRLSVDVRAFALGGLVYLLAHTALNRYWGGLAFNYRYAIEPLTLAMPALALGWTTVRSRRPQLSRILIATLILAVVLQGTDALLSGCETVSETTATCRIIDLR